ncbi:MAG: nuclear transport factor 2 family protein [Rubrivivax sp.]
MSMPASRLTAAASAALLACCAAVAADAPAAHSIEALEARIAALETRVAEAEHSAQAARDRGAVENVFSHYMYLHNTFQDEKIKALWAKRGTPGMSAQYSNLGVYTNYDSIMAYHSGRPTPTGKLVFHYLTTPLVEVAADGKTAKGRWIAAGVESGLMTPEVAAKAPAFLFEKAEADGNEVHGKKVWAHWVQMQYGVDFIRQDGEWKILHFRCFEVSRARFDKNWIALAAEVQDSSANSSFNADLMYLGDDGKPVFMPKVDGPPKSLTYSYRPDAAMAPDVPIPVPYRTLSDTFEY